MSTNQDDDQQTRAGPPSPVTPKSRAVSVNSPPAAPRRVTIRRPVVHRHDGSCCVRSPQMHPTEFARLLRASAGPAVFGPALGASGPPGVGGHEFGAEAHTRLAVPSDFEPSGFVVGFTGVEDDPFLDSRADGDVREETNLAGKSDMSKAAEERMAKFLGLVAAAVVVAADVLATVPEVHDGPSTTSAVCTASREEQENMD